MKKCKTITVANQKGRDDIQREKIHNIPLINIDTFPNHPFQVKQDDDMRTLVESIKTIGIQTPTIVRPNEKWIKSLEKKP